MATDALPAPASSRGDIVGPADIDRLVAAFYRAVLPDPIIGFIFTDIARIDLAHHLPVISAFWQQQLLGRPGYRGQTFAAHRLIHERFALTADHFYRWLYLFNATVDRLFCGPLAEAAKRRAALIARSMQEALARRYPNIPEQDTGVLFWDTNNNP